MHGRKTLIASGVLLAALTAACGNDNTAAPSAGQTQLTTPTTTTTADATTTTEATSSAAAPPATADAGAGPTGTSQADNGAATGNDCKAADLKLAVRDGDAAAGTVYRSLVFTNSGTRTCTIQGFPGVSYVAGADGHQVGPAAFRVGAKGAPVTLAPGQSASADVGFVNVRNYDAAACKPTEVRGLRVYPPHDTASMFVELPGVGCAGSPPGNQLTVKTVVK
ncbi:Protein of unknown function [Actinokineospora iranica]|uniref:DUF4232 domain-containing protein n=1 Tax=Actinokineospora iranica TaxID=1271860 RepID=A0A1G6P586_9PSEU|nr:Protein of unknown function [Actinokineospora iranica]